MGITTSFGFYTTHPYVSAPVMGVTLALEEERANGAHVEDAAIQGVKLKRMGTKSEILCSGSLLVQY